MSLAWQAISFLNVCHACGSCVQSVTVPAEQTALSNARAKLADDKTAWSDTAVHIAKEEGAAALKKAQEEHAMQVEASMSNACILDSSSGG